MLNILDGGFFIKNSLCCLLALLKSKECLWFFKSLSPSSSCGNSGIFKFISPSGSLPDPGFPPVMHYWLPQSQETIPISHCSLPNWLPASWELIVCQTPPTGSVWSNKQTHTDELLPSSLPSSSWFIFVKLSVISFKCHITSHESILHSYTKGEIEARQVKEDSR